MKKIFVTGLVICSLLIHVPAVSADTENITDSTGLEVIREYFELVNNKEQELIPGILSSAYAEDTAAFYSNGENKENQVGIFNIDTAVVDDAVAISNDSSCASVNLNAYEGTSGLSLYFVKADLKVTSSDEYFMDGINYFYFVTGIDNGQTRILEFSVPTYEEIKQLESNQSDAVEYIQEKEMNKDDILITPYSYDAPVSDVTSNPSTISVLRKSSGKVDKVNFKTYCKVVTSCEVGYSTWKSDALKASAMAIKNYGIQRTHKQKHPGEGCDVYDTQADQVYNPDKTRLTECDTAVDDIYNYFMYDSDTKLFPGFHVANVKVSKYASKNGGILSQEGSRDLAKNGSTWKDILHNYYDKVSGTSYYNSEVASGKIQITEHK